MSAATTYSGRWDLFLAFAAGAGAMAVEIVASRLLAPYFGASLFVWTSLILIILVALAVGYWFGGVVAERGVDDTFVGLLLCSTGGLLLIGIWTSRSLSEVLSATLAAWPGSSIALFAGSLATAAVVFALPVLVMGMLGPILLKRLSASGDVGRAAGRYLVASTAGSVFGTLLPTLVLVPYIGSRHSLALIAALFIVISAVTLSRRKRALLLILAVPALMFTALREYPAPAGMVYEKESPYQLIRVLESAGRRYLIFNEGSGVQSLYAPADERTGMYYDYFSLLPLLRTFREGEHRVAVLGLAGGTGVRRYLSFLPAGSSVDFVGVEVDPSVISVAKRYFGLDELPVSVINQDARNFLKNSDDKFDTVIVDAYSTQLYVPPHLVTGEFFGLVKSRLKPDGLLAMNINVTGVDSPLFRSLIASVAGHFSRVTAVPVADSYNQMVIASDGPVDLAGLQTKIPDGYGDMAAALRAAVDIAPASGRPFTDDWAPVEFMTDAMIVREALRQRL